MGVGNLRGGLLVDFALACDAIEQDDVLLKSLGLGGHFPAGGQGHAGAIEDQRIVPAHLVDINHRALVMDGNGAKHVHAQEALVNGVRRSGNINEHAGAKGDEFGDGITGVERLVPEVFVVPDVFADRDAELFAAHAVDVLLIAWLEVAGLVEHVVGGQEHFALLEDDAALANQRGFVGNGLPCPAVVQAAGVANDGRERHLRGNFLQRVVIALNKRGAFQKVEREIAADTEFREDREFRAALLGFRCKRKNA